MFDLVSIITILSLFVGTPLILFSFLHFNRKMKVDLQKLEHQKEILAMELKKEELIIERMSLENKMLDRKIDQIE
jgi:short subunit fatty acids transporter